MIHDREIILATRIHLGKQSIPPCTPTLTNTLSAFLQTASSINASKAVIAVDPEEKIAGYDLVSAIEQALAEARKELSSCTTPQHCAILKVSPWGNFVPALNALTAWACQNQDEKNKDESIIMFISAETTVTKETVGEMTRHMTDDTLVVGAVLPGHDYHGAGNGNDHGVAAYLNGRTCPWNTTAMWNLNKLAIFGFPLVAEGVHKLKDGTPVAAGIEEFATIMLHQRMSPGRSKAKLVKVAGVEWEQNFEDEERRKWHEAKMKSKHSRAEVHRSFLGGGEGKVIHY